MDKTAKACASKKSKVPAVSATGISSWFFAIFRGAVLLSVTCIACSLLACSSSSNKPAPEPKENPNPRIFSKFRVKVDSPQVDDLQVHSDWTIHHFGCAPINQPAGNLNVGQPNPLEKVTRTGPGEYEVSIEEDRYVMDACQWTREGAQFNFMRKGEIFSMYVMKLDKSKSSAVYRITCLPRTEWFGSCDITEHMTPIEISRAGQFNGLIEVLP